MLSLSKGKPIAIIKGGQNHNTIINIKPAEEKKQEPPSGKLPRNRRETAYFKSRIEDLSPDTLREVPPNGKPSREHDPTRGKKELYIYDEGQIEPLPDFNNTQRIYISGPTGSGKSYYIRKWLKQYQKVYPNRKIYLFSDMEKDPALDDFKQLVRFKIDDTLKKKKPIKPSTFSDSIVIFDDIDSIQDPATYKIIVSLQNAVLKTGRKLGITCITTNHLMNNGIKTKEIYNECSIIVFPTRGCNFYALNYALKKYLGMNTEQVKHIAQLPTRMCTVYKDYPQYVMYEKGIYLL